jgi:hypothetical protein
MLAGSRWGFEEDGWRRICAGGLCGGWPPRSAASPRSPPDQLGRSGYELCRSGSVNLDGGNLRVCVLERTLFLGCSTKSFGSFVE